MRSIIVQLCVGSRLHKQSVKDDTRSELMVRVHLRDEKMTFW